MCVISPTRWIRKYSDQGTIYIQNLWTVTYSDIWSILFNTPSLNGKC